MIGLKNIIGGVGKVGDAVDKNTTTQHEVDQELTTRHKNDMISDNWLSKSIRPLTLLILLVLQIFIVVASAFGYTADEMIIGQHGLLLLTALGFYFRSRQLEKVAKENAKGNIEIRQIETESERERTKEELTQLKLDRAQERKLERIRARRGE